MADGYSPAIYTKILYGFFWPCQRNAVHLFKLCDYFDLYQIDQIIQYSEWPQIPGRSRDHSLHQWVHTNPGAHPVSCLVGTKGYFVKGMTKPEWTLLVYVPDTKF